MKLLQKISAGILITWSLVISAAMIAVVADSNASEEDKQGGAAALVIFGLPPGALGGFMVWNLMRSSRKEREELEAKESDRLQSIFYLLLKKHHGELNPLLFAMETKLSPGNAKQYLDQKAKEFEANFDVDSHGDITYKFNVGRKSLGQNE